MSLSQPFAIYGVHNLTLFDRSTFLPFGTMKVIGSLNFNLASSHNDLFGGSNPYPWASESGVINSELSLTVKEFSEIAFSKFLGASVTTNSAETSGNVGTLANKFGTSVFDATTGITTSTAKAASESDIKDAFLIVKAVSATTVDVYAMSDVDFKQGTDKVFENDLLKITATPLTIATGAPVEIPGFGIELTGGSGTIALVTDDTAFVLSRKINTGSEIITIGESGSTFPEFGCKIASQKQSDGSNFVGTIYKCKAAGMPLNMEEAAFASADVVIKALYDSEQNAVAQYRKIEG